MTYVQLHRSKLLDQICPFALVRLPNHGRSTIPGFNSTFDLFSVSSEGMIEVRTTTSRVCASKNGQTYIRFEDMRHNPERNIIS